MKIIIGKEKSEKEKALEELARIRKEQANTQTFLKNDSEDDSEEIIKEPVEKWQKEIAKLISGKKTFAINKSEKENGTVYIKDDEDTWSAAIRKEGCGFYITISFVDKITFDIYNCDLENLKKGIEVIRKAVETWG